MTSPAPRRPRKPLTFIDATRTPQGRELSLAGLPFVFPPPGYGWDGPRSERIDAQRPATRSPKRSTR